MLKKKLLLLFLIAGLLFVPTLSFASEYEQPTQAIADEAKDLIDMNPDDTSNFDNLFTWLNDRKSFIFCNDVHGKPIYFFNTPDAQQNVLNMLQQINTGGFRGEFTTTPMGQNATTAALKYGYETPNYVYVGEYPVVFLDMQQVVDSVASPYTGATVIMTGLANILAAPLNLIGWVVLGWNVGYTPSWFNFVDMPELSSTDIKNLSYVNEDYIAFEEFYNADLASWLETNWYKFPSDLLLSIKVDGTVALDCYVKGALESKAHTVKATEETMFPEGTTIGSGEGEIHGDKLLNTIIGRAGNNYKVVLNTLISYAIQPENKANFDNSCFPEVYQLRNMPYDLDNMSQASKEYMQNIEDPRVKMFGGTALLGLFNVLAKQMAFEATQRLILAPTAFFCQASSFLNSLCDMSVLKDNGVDPTTAWTGTLGSFISIALLIIAVIVLAYKAVTSFLSANVSPIKVLAQGAGSVVLALIVLAAMLNPQALADTISNTAARIMSVSTQALKPDPTFSEFYTSEATDDEISELRFWYSYHNCWAQYATGHAITEDANDFNPSQNTNEYVSYEGKTYQNPATLKGDIPINCWSAQYLDTLYSNDTNNALRAVDHFLAPTITNDNYPEFSVAKNKSYTGTDMYMNVPWLGLLMALTIFVLTVFKLLCFIEFVVDFMLLLVRLALGAVNPEKNYIAEQFKTMLKELIKIVVFDTLITMVIFTTAGVSGAGYNILVFLEAAAVFGLIYHMIKNPSFVLCPAIVAPISRKVKIKSMVHKMSSGARKAKEAVANPKVTKERVKQQLKQVKEAEFSDKSKQLKQDIKNKKKQEKRAKKEKRDKRE